MFALALRSIVVPASAFPALSCLCNYFTKLHTAAYAWTHRSEGTIPVGRLADGIDGMLLLFKRMLKRKEMNFLQEFMCLLQQSTDLLVADLECML
jgi:hypothetical protein